MAQSNRVVCIVDCSNSSDQYGHHVSLVAGRFPLKDEICKVLETRDGTFCKKCYRLENYPHLWDADMFRPVDECGEKVLKQIVSECEEVTVPLTALFCMRLNLPVQLTQLK